MGPNGFKILLVMIAFPILAGTIGTVIGFWFTCISV